MDQTKCFKAAKEKIVKEKMVYFFSALFLIALAGAPALYAEADFSEVYSQEDTGASDPSAFEGDSDSKPGERAPENLPMSDAPVDAGVSVE